MLARKASSSWVKPASARSCRRMRPNCARTSIRARQELASFHAIGYIRSADAGVLPMWRDQEAVPDRSDFPITRRFVRLPSRWKTGTPLTPYGAGTLAVACLAGVWILVAFAADHCERRRPADP